LIDSFIHSFIHVTLLIDRNNTKRRHTKRTPIFVNISMNENTTEK